MNRPSPSQFPPFSGPGFGPEPAERRIEPSHAALPPGTLLAEYEILSVLGEGGSGIVYLAMDHGLQRQVVIKEYLPAALASRDRGTAVTLRSDGDAERFAVGLKSFIAEARLLAHVDHPALMRVYRFWEANRTAYMVMPYYEGVSLAAARQDMERPPDEAWLHNLLLPLLDALDVLHGASCYPRNISPESILLLPDGRPVLLDFGDAYRAGGDRGEASTVILEPAFAPIEQYADSTALQQGPWSNLYALAAVAYYCVSGESPVASTLRALDDQMEPLFAVVDRLGRSFPELNYSVAFVSAIERALNVRPEDRPQSVAEFRRALLGGRAAAESVVAPPVVEEAGPHGASPWLRSAPEETGPSQLFRSGPDGGKIGDGPAKRIEPGSREAAPKLVREARIPVVPPAQIPPQDADDARDAAWRAALDAALGPDTNDFDGAPQSGSGANAGDFDGAPQSDGGARASRRRSGLIVAAAVTLVVLGAGGWMMWSDYRDAGTAPRAMAPAAEPDGRPSALPPPEPPTTVLPSQRAEAPAPAPSAATTVLPTQPTESPAPVLSGATAAASLPPPEIDAPERAPGERPAGKAATVAKAPAEATTPPPIPQGAEEAPSPPSPTRVVKNESNNPRVLCGPRTQFSLYRCMKEACDRSRYFDHPECKYLRVTDEVRVLP